MYTLTYCQCSVFLVLLLTFIYFQGVKGGIGEKGFVGNKGSMVGLVGTHTYPTHTQQNSYDC